MSVCCKFRVTSRYSVFVLVMITVLVYVLAFKCNSYTIRGIANDAFDFVRHHNYFRYSSPRKDNSDSAICQPRVIPLDPFLSKIATDLSNWSFQKKRSCPSINITEAIGKPRKKIVLQCNGTFPELQTLWTNSSQDVNRLKFGDKCLKAYIEHCCTDGAPVPNVVHYVWFDETRVELFSLVSFISVVRFMNPCLIVFHGEYVPYGKFWDYFISIFPYVVHVQRQRPRSIFGQHLTSDRHGADVMRLEALLYYGGVYFDWDQVLLRPIDELRRYDVTMGLETPNALANGMILSAPNATFLQYYYDGYKNYTGEWNYNSIQYPYKLSTEFPDLVHIAGYYFFQPFYSLPHLYYKENYNWADSYAMHFYYIKLYTKKYSTIESIRHVNTTLGAVWRHVLFGNKELCAD